MQQDKLTAQYQNYRPHDSQTAEYSLNRTIAYQKQNIEPFLTGFDRSIRILELGPGTGLMARWLQDLGFRNYTAIDACQDYVDKLQGMGFRCFYGSDPTAVLNQKLAGETFDLILGIDVMEHIELAQVANFFEIAYQRLKPAGILLVQVPNVSGLFGWNTFTADPTHVTPFNEIRLESLFRAAGFHKTQMLPVLLPPSIPNIIRRIAQVLIFGFARLLMRLTGATPVRIMTHLMIAIGYK